MQPAETWETRNYRITHYPASPESVVVVFASAGLYAVGAPIEEFKGSLSKLAASAIFVVDNDPAWLSHADAPEAMAFTIAAADKYRNVAAMGESMGGSCAIAFQQFFPRVSRILAVAPQYSMMVPFILFDHRFTAFGDAHKAQRFPVFSAAGAAPKTQILYGIADWKDAVHAAMYKAEGYHVHMLGGAGHLVAEHLKRQGRLLPLLEHLLDFQARFDAASVARLLGPQDMQCARLNGLGFTTDAQWAQCYGAWAENPSHMPPPPDLVDLARGRPTNQSSVAPESRRPSTQEDSAGAVRGLVTGSYAFHTLLEDSPWWSVDLEQEREVHEIRIYNRLESRYVCYRGRRFVIETMRGEDWVEVFRKADDLLFGGADGEPFCWRPATPLAMRHIRIRLLQRNFLHYDAIEVFGPP